MTTAAIIESGMTFGPYPAGQCFYVEKSKCYKDVQEGVQMAEFLLLRQQQQGPTVWVVEAKSSSPRPKTQPNFGKFIDEIRNKLTNGFLLAVAACLRRHPAAEDELPEAFKTFDVRTHGFKFVLVIEGHKPEWLPPLKSALEQALKPVVKTWALPPLSVVVLNHEGAQRHGLILPMRAAGGAN
ncbi:hypothetical protein [Xylophilus ampelinus]|uniref:Uncharacterized protein n=1 Tax=Xylophilus ampelinus TaxID=54067 RepID=A0A318SCM2_9BURK|nr:hypothetical protein [Xylophilus ampelinus]MCS4511536.1 hypothetical protein [Xylophilus ampelinus]PYE74342.1 hypothetical protein DFQ15_12515 [Xylophilus ampelinus]